MSWPEAFKEEMHRLFAEQGMEQEEGSFFASLEEEKWRRAWRVNRLRISPEEAARLLAEDFPGSGLGAEDFLQPVPWSRDGFYIPEGIRPGLSHIYRLGLIYIQEASAMLPAECLDARPGEVILDLCAAPGGKSSQILAALEGRGLLAANDISESRARVLQRNIEQQGLEPSVVISADPQKDFPPEWDGFFDAVQLDAPCSGEGMFRRDPAAKESWEEYGPDSIRKVQRGLLEKAASLLKAGGRLVYSTCTFNKRENEEMLAGFLAAHEEFCLSPLPPRIAHAEGLRPGLSVPGSSCDFSLCRRVWPQDGKGEGHFAALLKKASTASDTAEAPAPLRAPVREAERLRPDGKEKRSRKKAPRPALTLQEAEAALRDFLNHNFAAGESWLDEKKEHYVLRLHQNWLYLLPRETPLLRGVKVLKSGTFTGELKMTKKGALLQPAHSWILELQPEELKKELALKSGSPAAEKVLSGQTLVLDEEQAAALAGQDAQYLMISLDGFPLAWGRQNGRTVKNLYPQGWVRS